MSINQALRAVDSREAGNAAPSGKSVLATMQIAIQAARHWHHNKYDPAGEPYIQHCERVAHHSRQLCQKLGLPQPQQEWIEQLAWMHDLFEKTNCSPVDLYDRNSKSVFGADMVSYIAIMTRDSNRDGSYVDFCAKLAEKAPPECLLVKLACNLDDSDHSRIDRMPIDFHGKRKWKKGRAYLYRGLERHFAPDKVTEIRNTYKYVDG